MVMQERDCEWGGLHSNHCNSSHGHAAQAVVYQGDGPRLKEAPPLHSHHFCCKCNHSIGAQYYSALQVRHQVVVRLTGIARVTAPGPVLGPALGTLIRSAEFKISGVETPLLN